jgi:hypothetical protein
MPVVTPSGGRRVQPGRVRLIIQPGTADVGSRRMIKEFFPDGILVEPLRRCTTGG